MNAQKMKAILYSAYGGTEKLMLQETKKPDLKSDEVLIRVCAVSVNDFDLGMLMGVPYILRVQNGISKPKKVHILGSDIAGKVEAVGASVTKFQIGDRVYGDLSDRWGGFEEYCAANESEVKLMPDSLTYTEAAALPQAGALAYQALFDYGKAKEGERVLINGAGGGVGTLGVQMAKEAGLVVDGVDTPSKFDVMKATGFRNRIDYRTEDFTQKSEVYDIVIDNKMNRPIRRCLKVLKPGGRYLVIGGGSWSIFKVLILSTWIRLFTNKRIQLVMLKKNRGLEYMEKLHLAGNLQVIMEPVVSLNKGIEAIETYSQNNFTGKVVIDLAGNSK